MMKWGVLPFTSWPQDKLTVKTQKIDMLTLADTMAKIESFNMSVRPSNESNNMSVRSTNESHNTSVRPSNEPNNMSTSDEWVPQYVCTSDEWVPQYVCTSDEWVPQYVCTSDEWVPHMSVRPSVTQQARPISVSCFFSATTLKTTYTTTQRISKK